MATTTRKRTKAGRFAKASARRAPARRKATTKRKPAARKGKSPSAATRAKISRAVKAANRRGGKAPARRKSTMAVARRRAPARRKTAVSRRRAPARRKSARRFSGGVVLRGSTAVKRLTSAHTLTLVAGIAGATGVSNAVMVRWGNKLPGSANPWGRILWSAAIPVGASLLVTRVSRKPMAKTLADGLIIGAALSVAIEAMRQAGLGYILDGGIRPGVAAPPAGAGTDPGVEATGGYVMTDGAPVGAYANSAWGGADPYGQ